MKHIGVCILDVNSLGVLRVLTCDRVCPQELKIDCVIDACQKMGTAILLCL